MDFILTMKETDLLGMTSCLDKVNQCITEVRNIITITIIIIITDNKSQVLYLLFLIFI